MNEEILKLKMQRNIKLKQNIGEIVDQNPQIVAKISAITWERSCCSRERSALGSPFIKKLNGLD